MDTAEQDWRILRNRNARTPHIVNVKRENIALWRDRDLAGGIDMLRAVCSSHRYAAHSHDEFVIACFEAGAQRHRIARKIGVAVPGSVMIIPPGEVHTGEAEEDVGMWAYRAFYPRPEALEEIASDIFGRSGIVLDFGRHTLHEDSEVAGLLLQAHNIIENSRDPIEKDGALAGAFDLLIRRYGASATGASLKRQTAGNIRRALELIHACFRQRLTTGEIASAVGLSEYHFMRSFKEKTGMTVHAYVTQVRLRAAKDLLASGLSPAETAVSVGFFDQSHFTNHFRSSFGVTPKRYAVASS